MFVTYHFDCSNTPYTLHEFASSIGIDWRTAARYLGEGSLTSCTKSHAQQNGSATFANYYSILRFCCIRNLSSKSETANLISQSVVDRTIKCLARSIEKVENLQESPAASARHFLRSVPSLTNSIEGARWVYGFLVPASCTLFGRSRGVVTRVAFSDHHISFFFNLGLQLSDQYEVDAEAKLFTPLLN